MAQRVRLETRNADRHGAARPRWHSQGEGHGRSAAQYPAGAAARRADRVSSIDPLGRLRSAGKRVTDPMEALAQQVAERVVGMVATALDVNALVARIDVNALLGRIDINALLRRVDVNALLSRLDLDEVMRRVDIDAVVDRVDVNEIAGRIDMDALVEETDLGAVIAKSSGGFASEALDAARSQAVGLDQSIDRWAGRLLRRRQPSTAAPSAPSGPVAS